MNMFVSHWSANAVVLAVAAVVVVAHLLGMRALRAEDVRAGRARPADVRRQAVAFYAGVITVVLALVSPVGYWSQVHIWVRSVQDLLLIQVGPALIVLGAPWLALARGAGIRQGRPGPAKQEPAGASGSQAAVPAATPRPGWSGRRSSLLTWPVGATIAVNAALWIWHLPVLYDAAVRSAWIYAAEVVVYLGLGVAFWLQLIGSAPLTPRFAPLKRVILVAGTVVSGTLLGGVLGFSNGLSYRAYLVPDHGLARALSDQQVGGAVLWVLAMPTLVITGVALLNRWLKEEESDALTAGLDRLLKQPTSAWPSGPGLR